MKTEVRVARLENDRAALDAVVRVLTHPVFSIVAGFVIIEALQTVEIDGKPLMGTVSGSALEAALITGGVINSLGTSGALDKLLPLLTK